MTSESATGAVERVRRQGQEVLPEPVPQGQSGPVGLVDQLLGQGEERVGQHRGHELFVPAVEQAQSPGDRAAVSAQAAVELGFGAAPDPSQFGAARGVLADAQVEVPATER